VHQTGAQESRVFEEAVFYITSVKFLEKTQEQMREARSVDAAWRICEPAHRSHVRQGADECPGNEFERIVKDGILGGGLICSQRFVASGCD
jgi:hypothetical protein